MSSSPAVLLLDDGELDDIQGMLEELKVPFARVRGGAIVRGMAPPSNLLISTPRRIDAVGEALGDDAGAPIRMVVVSEDSNSLRNQLRRVGFDFMVRRPVHPEALKLLVMHCLYQGEERRTEPRVSVGVPVSIRAGLRTRRATLADLSIRGCRLLTEQAIDAGKKIRVQIPEALDAGDPFTVTGKVVRSQSLKAPDGTSGFVIAVTFDPLSDEARDALEILIEDRAQGPATLRRTPARVAEPDGAVPKSPSPPRELDEGLGTPLQTTTVSVEEESPPATAREAAEPLPPETAEVPPDEDRRKNRRGHYSQTVPAFGNRALRVLVGRDLSVAGMRIERLPGLELGDRLHLAIYGDPGESPFLVWASVTRDDGDGGMALSFDPLDRDIGERLERLVGSLPSVESLHDTEAQAMGSVMTEILTE